ncbi:RecQ family ATP-dependent DNA helicase [Salsuginibacillus halophilus]|nr:RecQ family ATP-dependent DNA helicase [Salsuginibacillus halophilus]
MSLEEGLHRFFGFENFRPGQKAIIEDVMHGRDCLAVLPTGGGKSLLYQLPALLSDGLAIIVSPLIALMEDQVQELRAFRMKQAVCLHSGLSQQERKVRLHAIESLKLLYLSPEMLSQPWMQRLLKHQKLSFVAVDEAHCISQWGHEFRPDYQMLGHVLEVFGRPPVLALTATATPAVREDIYTALRMKENARIHLFSLDRTNIRLFGESVMDEKEKQTRLFTILHHFQRPVLVYVMSRSRAEALAERAAEALNLRTAYYHGGMDAADRQNIQAQFLADELDVVICTSAFGMGINKPDVAAVIHYHMPSNIESYMQEIGRAGRSGKDSAAVVLYAPGDENLPHDMMLGEFPPPAAARMLLEDTSLHGALLTEVEKQAQGIGLSEVQARYVVYQLFKAGCFHSTNEMKQLSRPAVENVVRELSDRIMKRRKEKEAQIEEVKAYILFTGCRRQKLLAHFNEETVLQDASICCDHCLAVWPPGSEKVRDREDLSWQGRLQKLLLPDKRSNEKGGFGHE